MDTTANRWDRIRPENPPIGAPDMMNIYFEKDADGSVVQGRKVAVIGYG